MIEQIEQTTCICGTPIIQKVSARGHRARLYCSNACRLRASYRARNPQAPVKALPKIEKWTMPDLPFLSSKWRKCVEAWVQASYERSHSEPTRRLYERTVYAFLEHVGKPVEDITQEDVLSFIHSPSQSMRNPGSTPSPGTTNNRLNILKSLFNFASSFTIANENGRPERVLTALPATSGLHAGKPTISYKSFSLDELERLFAAIPTDTIRGLRARAIFSVYFWSCRRRMEVARLTYGSLEQATIIGKDGKRRMATVYTFRGKGHSQEDDRAELPEPAVTALNRYLEASGRMSTIRPEDPLFARLDVRRDIDPHRPLSDAALARELKYYARKAGMDPRTVHLHVFRHAGARMRYEAGSDIREVQAVLRHKSIATTDTYLRMLVSVEDTGAKRLEQHYSRFS